jgi:hypothetical protein
MGEFAFAFMLMKSSLAMKKAFNNERLTNSCCNWLWYCCINLTVIKYLTINQDVLFGSDLLRVSQDLLANCIGNCWLQQLAAPLMVLGLGKYQLTVASLRWRSMLCLAS